MNEIYYIPKTSDKNFEKLLSKLNFDIIEPNSFVALKTHFGEEGNTTFIKPQIYKPLVKILLEKKCLPFFTDTNTIYTGKRSNAITHIKLAEKHGFKIDLFDIPVIIADGIKGNNYVEVEINLKHFKKAKVASDIYYSDFLICLSHFKGHMLFGFAGAIKNLGMGCAARPGKYLLHNVLKPKFEIKRCIGCWRCIKYCPTGALKIDTINNTVVFNVEECAGCAECIHICERKVFSIPWDLSYKDVQERTVEYAYAVLKNKTKKVFFINFLSNITKDCDCINKTQKPAIEDIGIVAGDDPVAVDFASFEIVKNYYGKDLFKEFWGNIDYTPQIEYAQEIGLGTKDYKLFEVN